MSTREQEDRRVAGALQSAGIQVNSVFDLVNRSEPYPEAIPVLLRILKEGVNDSWIAEGVVRALTVREARGKAAQLLLDMFEQLPMSESGLKWTIGNALSVIANGAVRHRLAGLARDKRHGPARQMIVQTLGRFKDREITALLIQLLDDEDVVAHALIALGRQRAHEARPHVERLTASSNTLVRKTARRVLAKLDAA